jgi:hypothetical protein
MIHLFFDRKPWFRAKRYGLGTGFPMAWQGWLLLALHVALVVGLAAALEERPLAMAISIAAAAVLPLPIYAARTEGGWRWRWGNKGN